MAGSGRRMLADMLAELVNPVAADIDPEAAGADRDVVQTHDEQLERLLESGPAPGQKRLSMRADIDLDDEAYKGRKTSRKALALDEDGFLDSSPQLAGSEGDEEEDGLGLSEGLEDDEDEDGGSDADAGTDGADMDSQGDEGEEDEATDGQLGTEGGSEDPEGGWKRSQGLVGSDEADELQRMYEAQADGAALVEGVKQRVQKERAKGLAVRNQQVLYERALEARILLQKVVAGANRLPAASTTSHLLSLVPADAPASGGQQQPVQRVAAQTRAVSLDARRLLQELLGLYDSIAAGDQKMMDQAAGASQDTAAQASYSNSRKRMREMPEAPQENGSSQPVSTSGQVLKPDTLWEQLSARYDVLVPYRDSSLDKWHRRTQLSSGSGALKANLKALSQSVSSQVSAMMRDPTKLVRRSQLLLQRAPNQRRLGDPQPGGSHAKKGHEGGAEDGDAPAALQGVNGALLAEAGPGGLEAEEHDAETYDDLDFYQHLLKDFIDRSTAGAGGNGLLVSNQVKKRKVVDRRASKGRKIRYDVQEKLVNFMAPVHQELPPFAAQLFSNLFAHTA